MNEFPCLQLVTNERSPLVRARRVEKASESKRNRNIRATDDAWDIFLAWLRLKDFNFDQHVEFLVENHPIDVSDLPEGMRITDKHNRIQKESAAQKKKRG